MWRFGLRSGFYPQLALPSSIPPRWPPHRLPPAPALAAEIHQAQHLHFSTHFLHPILLRIMEDAVLTPKSLQYKQAQFSVWVREMLRKVIVSQHPLNILLTCFMSFPHSLSISFV